MSSKRRRLSATAPSQSSLPRKRGDWAVLSGLGEHLFFYAKRVSETELVLGNLDANHTEKDLREALQGFGQIER